MGQLFVSLQNTQTKLSCKMARIVASVALLACSTLAAPQFQGDSSNARILQEQRFNAGAGKFGSAFAQEDGVVYREESGGNNERIGQYSYIGDDGKTYTVKYSAGVNGFRIIGGDPIPSGGQTSAAPLPFGVETTPRPNRFFPPGQIKLDRFPEGFNF